MPGADALREASRRRRASGGPAEQTFATLVGLELRPRRLREAAALWWAVTEQRGIAGRDAVWGHPDLLPSAEDLDDPLGFAEKLDAQAAATDPLTALDIPSTDDEGDPARRAHLRSGAEQVRRHVELVGVRYVGVVHVRSVHVRSQMQPGGCRDAVEIPPGPLGARVATDQRPERAGRDRARSGVPARGPGRNRAPRPASPGAAAKPGSCDPPGCRRPTASASWVPSAPGPGSPARPGASLTALPHVEPDLRRRRACAGAAGERVAGGPPSGPPSEPPPPA